MEIARTPLWHFDAVASSEGSPSPASPSPPLRREGGVHSISTKCPPQEAFQVAAVFKAYLANHGIVLGADQSAKTKSSL